MAYDGNGNWVSNYHPQAGDKIEASTFNNQHIADIEESFENCVTRDGQGKFLTNVNANNNRVINVSDPINPKDAVNKQTADTTNATCVHISGNETIAGNKTFSGSVTIGGSATFNGSTSIGSSLTLSSSAKETISHMSSPNFAGRTNYTSGMTCASDGYMFLNAYGADYVENKIYVNGVQQLYSQREHITWTPVSFPVAKGDVVSHSGGDVTGYFVPCKR